jgi:hypothetical protein
MAFLDNSRDIILDAVLTDLGRRRLAEGKFSIQRFALGDDEINYGLYDVKNQNGSAYYDLEILQTPVFEAFTNNISTMNSKLVTYTGGNLLYLPIMKINIGVGTSGEASAIEGTNELITTGIKRTTIPDLTNIFMFAVDSTTYSALSSYNVQDGSGIKASYLRVDQGIDNNVIDSRQDLSSEFIEDQYTVEVDNRFAFLSYGTTKLEPTFIDDDNVALYTFSRFNTEQPVVIKLAKLTTAGAADASSKGHVLAGARGSAIRFAVYANDQLNVDTANSNYLFTTFGTQVSIGGSNYKVIHSTATITGLKTGYSIDVPISFIKKMV